MSGKWDVDIQWNLPYSDYLNILNDKKNILKNHPEKRFLLICSHPHCFTHGRGLRNLDKNTELLSFDPSMASHLPYPLHNINRGGGLTFHYPGQVIVYPLVNLNQFPKALMTLMHHLLTLAGETSIELNFLKEFEINKKIFGLWSEDKKIASIGMGLDHYITEHGMALNFFDDTEMFNVLNTLYPCGISANTYSTLESMSGIKSSNDRSIWVNLFLKKFLEKFS